MAAEGRSKGKLAVSNNQTQNIKFSEVISFMPVQGINDVALNQKEEAR